MNRLKDKKLNERIKAIAKLGELGELDALQTFVLHLSATFEVYDLNYNTLYEAFVLHQKTINDFLQGGIKK